MKITTFNPMILSSKADEIIKLFEELGFERRHEVDNVDNLDISSVRMKDANGFCVDVARVDSLPKDMTTISWKMFMNVDLSKGIEIPETLTSIGVSAFEQSNLREIHLPEGLTSIGSRAFAVCWSLKSITIPASVRTIPSCLFADTQLDTLYIMSPTPPEAEEPLFVDINSDQDPWAKQPVLVVPQGSKQLYQEAPVWSHFDKIIEYSPATGVCSLSKNPAAPEAYYSLDGRRLTHPQKGINIIRMSDGTTRKVYE